MGYNTEEAGLELSSNGVKNGNLHFEDDHIFADFINVEVYNGEKILDGARLKHLGEIRLNGFNFFIKKFCDIIYVISFKNRQELNCSYDAYVPAETFVAERAGLLFKLVKSKINVIHLDLIMDEKEIDKIPDLSRLPYFAHSDFSINHYIVYIKDLYLHRFRCKNYENKIFYWLLDIAFEQDSPYCRKHEKLEKYEDMLLISDRVKKSFEVLTGKKIANGKIIKDNIEDKQVVKKEEDIRKEEILLVKKRALVTILNEKGIVSEIIKDMIFRISEESVLDSLLLKASYSRNIYEFYTKTNLIDEN